MSWIQIALFVLLLVSPFLLYYFVIRKLLQGKITDLHNEIESFWARWWARIVSFRSFFIASFGAFIAAVPELLEGLHLVDFSFLPSPWAGYVAGAVSVALTLNRVFSTLPGARKA